MSACGSVVHQIVRDYGCRALAGLRKRLPAGLWETVRHGLAKVMACGTPSGGYAEFRCEKCGERKVLCFTCKSRLCPSCGWLRVARQIESLQARMIQCAYRHMVFCVPRELRKLLYERRELLPTVCHAAAAAVRECYQHFCKTHELVPGIIATCHTFGSNLRFHVHVHLLVTEGALQKGGKWQPIHIFLGHEYRRRWQYHLLTMLRKAVGPEDPWAKRIGKLFKSHPTGFIVNFESRYPNARSAVRYCCRYVARPPMGDRRIVSYDGKHVVFTYKDYRSKKSRQVRCTGYQFVMLLLQHALPKGARNIHYYGLYRVQAWRRCFAEARAASRHPERIATGTPEHLSWRQRIIQAFARDPLRCPKCGALLVVVDIRPPPRVPAAVREARRQERAGQLSLALT